MQTTSGQFVVNAEAPKDQKQGEIKGELSGKFTMSWEKQTEEAGPASMTPFQDQQAAQKQAE